jgi:hypothetical protein
MNETQQQTTPTTIVEQQQQQHKTIPFFYEDGQVARQQYAY